MFEPLIVVTLVTLWTVYCLELGSETVQTTIITILIAYKSLGCLIAWFMVRNLHRLSFQVFLFRDWLYLVMFWPLLFLPDDDEYRDDEEWPE